MARKLSAAALAAAARPEPIGAQVEQIPVAGLVRHPHNARSISPTAEQTKALSDSVRAVGVLMPVLVARTDAGELGVLAGWQRVSAARANGLATVPGILVDQGTPGLDRLSLVENALRSEMHPVDTWRSVDTLMQGGATFAAAAATLGLSEREAGQMRVLAKLHPDLLAALAREDDMPGTWILREIVRTAPERQAEVLAAATRGKGKAQRVEWNSVLAGCKVTRISRQLAVFPWAKSNVVFELDLFAEPGGKDEWTTTDVEGFRTAQAAALAQLVEGNERALVLEYSPTRYGPTTPAGWRQLRWFDKVPKELPELPEDHRFVVSLKDSGEAVAFVFQLPAEAMQEAGAPGSTAAKPPPRLITDAGLQMAATMKHAALREALAAFLAIDSAAAPAVLLRALLECLGATNVTPGAADKHAPGEAIAEAAPNGGEPDPRQLARIAADAIAAMLIFPAPKTLSSGPIADDVAHSLGAEPYLPRFDTPEFLAQCSGALLREAAKGVERQPGQKLPGSVVALRDFLVGKLPNWRPVTFCEEAAANG